MNVIIKKLTPVYTDDRGSIFDLIENTVGHVGLITCKKGSRRGDHYHKESMQYTYIIKGKMELITKSVVNENADTEKIIVDAGDMIVIPPRIIHTLHALEESVIVDATTLSRNADGYEKDTVRVVPI